MLEGSVQKADPFFINGFETLIFAWLLVLFSNNIFLNQKRHYICSPEQNGYGLVP